MTYDEALDYIHSIKWSAIKPGLTRINNLLSKLGNPQKKLKFIHVAGTNGKGSTTATIDSILRDAGYRVGMYVSPFVERFNERIRFNGRYITDDELIFETEVIKDACDALCEEGKERASEFETITAMAMDFFCRKGCDFVVLEVGLGGRLDATNAIDTPEVSVITSISMDHTLILGDTVEKIAAEKCGILKRGTVCVTCANQNKAALEVIKDTCQKLDIPLVVPEITFDANPTISGTDFTYRGLNFHVSLLGEHQIYNALNAIEAVFALRDKGYTISDENIVSGVLNTRFGGRFEIVNDNPLCIIDGAHNIDGMNSLCNTLNTLLEGRKKLAVVAMMMDKDCEGVIDRLSRCADMVITTTCNMSRSMPPERLSDLARRNCNSVFVSENVEEAVEIALDMLAKDDVLIVCGSLYILGDAKKYMLDRLYSTKK